ncbi:hypothetical protein [Actinosynnema sp. NPDC020468]|uniref:hypothetical protein n=1 Tax=Actinosynnema sp. NPDC020468 TaxID=3154488 RepID=UPI0033FA6D36
MEKLIELHLSPEWVTGPLWAVVEGGELPDNYSPEDFGEEFGLPADLVADVDAWDGEFQAVFDSADPMSGGFAEEDVADRWYARGEELAHRLAAALKVPIVYRTAGGRLVITEDLRG